MKTEELKDVMAWLKKTDVVEVSYNRGKEGFSLATNEAQPLPHYPIPAGRFTPVTSPAVGLFQWSALGKSRKAEEGCEVSEGAVLGLIETGKGASTPVLAPCAGRVARVFIDGGNSAEYGQVLLFLEPR